jgi:hypothetical protein
MIVPVGAWLALGVLVTGCSPAESAGVAAGEAPAQTCAIAYPDAEIAASNQVADLEGQEATVNPTVKPPIPPIDGSAPARTETATFALG